MQSLICETYRNHVIEANLNDDDYTYCVEVDGKVYSEEVSCMFVDDTFADIMTDIDNENYCW